MPYDWNDNPDFYLLFLPRSGSHMLVDALNSHPDLDVSHSDQGHGGQGHIKGHAQCVVDPKIKKAIILTRNSVDRMNSFFTNIAEVAGSNHTKKPIEIERKTPEKAENRYKNQQIKGEVFAEKAGKIEKILFLSYEELTGDQDIRQIPEEYGRKICEFLGVPYLPLTTQFHKPKVVK